MVHHFTKAGLSVLLLSLAGICLAENSCAECFTVHLGKVLLCSASCTRRKFLVAATLLPLQAVGSYPVAPGCGERIILQPTHSPSRTAALSFLHKVWSFNLPVEVMAPGIHGSIAKAVEYPLAVE